MDARRSSPVFVAVLIGSVHVHSRYARFRNSHILFEYVLDSLPYGFKCLIIVHTPLLSHYEKACRPCIFEIQLEVLN